MIKKIEDFLFKSVDKKYLSSSDKTELKSLLAEMPLSGAELHTLKRKAFSIGDKILSTNNDKKILEWVQDVTEILHPRKEMKPYHRVFFSPGNTPRDRIIKQLERATHSVKICVFTVSDDIISRQILKCIRKGIDVKIISDGNKTHDYGSDIQELFEKGAEVKIDHSRSHMHHKFALIDNHTAITGSYNWTRSAAEKNQENILISNQPEIFRSYYSEFLRLWNKLDDYTEADFDDIP